MMRAFKSLSLALLLGLLSIAPQVGGPQAATLFQMPKMAPVAANKSYASAKLYFYQPGTTTAITTYPTVADAAAHTNAQASPVQADANGVFAPIFIDEATNATYRVQFKTSASVLIYDVDNLPTGISRANIGAILYPRTTAEQTASVTPTNYFREPGDPRRYGALLDGSTNDSTALDSAIDQQQQTGGAAVIGVPGTTLYTSSWSTPTLTARLELLCNGMTIKNANSTRASFVTLEANFDIEDCTFDGWYRVINNTTATTAAITDGRLIGNTFDNATAGASNNAYYVLLQNPIQNLWIERNRFIDALVSPVYVGDNTYANQDTWKKITLRGNVVDGVTCAGGACASFGFLIYGRDVVVDGNDLEDIEGYTVSYNASNGAYGIYTKSRFTRIVNNAVRNVGLTTNADADQIIGINVKGADRSATTSPQGFAAVVANNTVLTVGVAATSGTGISIDHSGVTVHGNWIEDAGLKGIVQADSASSADGNIIDANVVIGSSNDAYSGIEKLVAKHPVNSPSLLLINGECQEAQDSDVKQIAQAHSDITEFWNAPLEGPDHHQQSKSSLEETEFIRKAVPCVPFGFFGGGMLA